MEAQICEELEAAKLGASFPSSALPREQEKQGSPHPHMPCTFLPGALLRVESNPTSSLPSRRANVAATPVRSPGFAHLRLKKDKKGTSWRKVAGLPQPPSKPVLRCCVRLDSAVRFLCSHVFLPLSVTSQLQRFAGRVITFFRGEIKGPGRGLPSVPDEANFPCVLAAPQAERLSGCTEVTRLVGVVPSPAPDVTVQPKKPAGWDFRQMDGRGGCEVLHLDPTPVCLAHCPSKGQELRVPPGPMLGLYF